MAFLVQHMFLRIFPVLLISVFSFQPLAAADGKDNTALLRVYEDSLKGFGREMFKGKDLYKAMANKKFIQLLEKALGFEGSYQYPFDSLNFMARLESPDKKFKIFNWNVPKEDGTHEYFGYIQTWDEKTKQARVFRLINKQKEIRNPEIMKLGPEKWYGALYYKIVPTTFRKKKSYTLIGWDGNNNLSWKKVLDVLTFRSDGTPEFGDDVFQVGKRYQYRVIYEFKAEMIMTLRWDDQMKMIVFDHLVPEYPGMANPPPHLIINSYSYNGYEYKKGKWNFIADVNAKNRKDKSDNKYVTPH
ncbi:MAG: hypothetical protein FD123_770 [Bacteroidetes bacterium]|nr:MAG: hypothetical protein FD123_770 [Bacteroidota bacterium]